MQKKEREITEKTSFEQLLKKGRYATISMCRKDEPYIVPLSYGFDEDINALYFHSANLGLKLDIIRDNPIVCGTVVEDLGYVKNACSHKYRSIVFWGEMTIVLHVEEKKHGFDVLLNHLEEKPSKMRNRFLKDEKSYFNTCIMKLVINKITGKASE
jgi:nitroimidazol reductase NimA-like FMN-containing flavoprotein (pyridoxamine 5'-phosphate oxidase superfamily)